MSAPAGPRERRATARAPAAVEDEARARARLRAVVRGPPRRRTARRPRARGGRGPGLPGRAARSGTPGPALGRHRPPRRALEHARRRRGPTALRRPEPSRPSSGLDVLHHFADPGGVLRRGRARARAPAVAWRSSSPGSRRSPGSVYRFFHQEDCRLSVDPWQPVPRRRKGQLRRRRRRALADRARHAPGALARARPAPPRVRRVNAFAYLLSARLPAGSLLPAAAARPRWRSRARPRRRCSRSRALLGAAGAARGALTPGPAARPDRFRARRARRGGSGRSAPRPRSSTRPPSADAQRERRAVDVQRAQELAAGRAQHGERDRHRGPEARRLLSGP